MPLRKKVYLCLFLLFCIILAAFIGPDNGSLVVFYDRWIFYPCQVVRGFLLNWVPFSFGDLLYILGGAALLYTIIQWIKYIRRFKVNQQRLWRSLLNTVNTALFVYLFFIVGWGNNYNKQPLGENWDLKFRGDTLRLATFDSSLTERLNSLAPQYRSLTLKEASRLSVANYAACTDSRVTSFGLHIKPSMFGYFLERLAIEGYYNPFTGEGQISGRLPAFMLPFVVSHEMAHQAGIAAEGDANLMAYAVCTQTADASFNYSANLNIWLYVHRRLFRKDSTLAKQIAAGLNKLTVAHIDTLERLSELYNNEMSYYSAEMFDSYLKMQHQKDGIKSYGSVTTMAWRLEQQRKHIKRERLHVP